MLMKTTELPIYVFKLNNEIFDYGQPFFMSKFLQLLKIEELKTNAT